MSAIGLRRLGLIVAAFVLQTALLRAALPGPDEAQARPSLAGQLLVAAPGMDDPRFERTVILIVEHGPDGALGIVINKPKQADRRATARQRFQGARPKGRRRYGQRARLLGRPNPAGSRLRSPQSRWRCQSNGRSSVCDIATPDPSGYQAMSARHSPSAAERLCL